MKISGHLRKALFEWRLTLNVIQQPVTAEMRGFRNEWIHVQMSIKSEWYLFMALFAGLALERINWLSNIEWLTCNLWRTMLKIKQNLGKNCSSHDLQIKKLVWQMHFASYAIIALIFVVIIKTIAMIDYQKSLSN